jgi:hypothetical protein
MLFLSIYDYFCCYYAIGSNFDIVWIHQNQSCAFNIDFKMVVLFEKYSLE